MRQIPAAINLAARTLLRVGSSLSEKNYGFTSSPTTVDKIIRVTQILFTALCFCQEGITKMSIFSVTAFLAITEIFRKAPYNQQKKIALLTDIFANCVKMFTSNTERNNRIITGSLAYPRAAPALARAHIGARVRDYGAIPSAEGERVNAIAAVNRRERYFSQSETWVYAMADARPARAHRFRDDGAIHSTERERLNAIEAVKRRERGEHDCRRSVRLGSMAAPSRTADAGVDTTYCPQD